MKRALLLTMLSLTACGSKSTPPTAEPKVEVPAAPSSELALPVTAPMAARERLLHDLDAQNEAARQRARDMDSVLERNR